VRLKLLNKACVWQGRLLDKKTAVSKSDGFAHSILWIFMGLSTEALVGSVEVVVWARLLA
jgi:hypothetical protein